MNCCSRPMWDIWSEIDGAAVAFGCRYCRSVKPSPAYQHLLTWARVKWENLLDGGLSPRGVTAKVEYPPPASRYILVEAHSIPQHGVPKGQKRCAMCKEVKPCGDFYPSYIDTKGQTRTKDGLLVYCKPCADKSKKHHQQGLKRLDKIASAILPVAERDDDIRRFACARDKLDKPEPRPRNHRVPKNKPGTFFCTTCRNQLPVANFTVLQPEQVKQQGRRRVNEYKGVCYRLMCVACTERGCRNKARIKARKKELGL